MSETLKVRRSRAGRRKTSAKSPRWEDARRVVSASQQVTEGSWVCNSWYFILNSENSEKCEL